MSTDGEETSGAPVSYPHSAAMNYSNAAFERVSERVERSRDDPQGMLSFDAGNLKAHPVSKKPGTQMLAASALAGLTKPSPNQKQEYVIDDDPDCDFQIPLRFTKSGRRRATPFPMKLMKVLSTRRFSDIISWTPDGTAFAIHRPKAFASEILPTYFKEAKYSSFTRKLHRWGFQRHLRGSDSGSFYHKNFQRGRLDLLDLMTCHKPRESSARAAGKFPKSSMMSPSRRERSDSLGFSSQGQQQQQQQQPIPMMPSADSIAEAQAIRARQQHAELMALQSQMGEVSEERLNAAIEMEVSRRLQQRVNEASFSRLAMMQQQGSPAAGMAPYDAAGLNMQAPAYNPMAGSSPGLPNAGPRGMTSFDPDLNARLQQQATALRLSRGSGGYDDARFPPPPRNYDEQQQQQPHHYDPNMDNMGRNA